MANRSKRNRFLWFEDFELDLQGGLLRKQGQRIHLPPKTFQLLAVLLEQPGEVVSREVLRTGLWSRGTYGDFDHRLNIVISKLRQSLSDSVRNPKYIETLAGKGYRFRASVKSGKNLRVRVQVEEEEAEKTKARLAVLPFEILGETSEHTYFREGLADEIATRLGHLYQHDLGVVARRATMKYGTTTADIGILEKLKVDYILDGCMQSAGDRIHLTAYLIKVSDHTYLWADSYDYRLGDPITIQNEVAERIARSLGLELLPARKAALAARGTPIGNAQLAYLKGRYYQSRRTEEGLRKSIQRFERAIHLDPNYALAYSALANSKSLLGSIGFGGGPPKDFFPQARQAAMKALQINDNLAECHSSLALVKYLYEWDWKEADKLFRHAIELNPSDAFSHQMYGLFLSSRGRHKEAIAETHRSCEFDPLSLSGNVAMGMAHYFARQYGSAIAVLQNTLEFEPAFGPVLMWLAVAYAQKGMRQDAILTVEKARHLHRVNAAILACAGAIYGKAQMMEEARQILDELAALSKEHYVSAFDFALIHTGLGQMDETFEWLEKAYDERSPFLAAYFEVDPRFDSLRPDLRYHELIQRLCA